MLLFGGVVIFLIVCQFLSGIGIIVVVLVYESVVFVFGCSVVLQLDMVWFILYGVVQDELCKGELVEVLIVFDFLGGLVGIFLCEDVVDVDI